MNKSAKVLHCFGLDCGLFEFFRSSTHKPFSKRKMYTFGNFFGDWFVEKRAEEVGRLEVFLYEADQNFEH
jgi:hypothetical protein